MCGRDGGGIRRKEVRVRLRLSDNIAGCAEKRARRWEKVVDSIEVSAVATSRFGERRE